MTKEEAVDAMNALVGWFESQEISPKEATLLMVALIAAMMTQRTKDSTELKDGITRITNLLTMQVAINLEGAPNGNG